MRKRAASHAGSWYENNPQTLARQLTGWLEKARLNILKNTVRKTINLYILTRKRLISRRLQKL